MPGPRTRIDNHSRGMELSKKAGVSFGRRLNEQKSWRKLYTDHQRGQYYEHSSRSIVPRELKEKQRYLPLLSFSRWDQEIYSLGGGNKDHGRAMLMLQALMPRFAQGPRV